MGNLKDGFIKGLGFGVAVLLISGGTSLLALKWDSEGSSKNPSILRAQTAQPEGIKAKLVGISVDEELGVVFDVALSNNSDKAYERISFSLIFTIEGKTVASCRGSYLAAIEPGGKVVYSNICGSIHPAALEFMEHRVEVQSARYIVRI